MHATIDNALFAVESLKQQLWFAAVAGCVVAALAFFSAPAWTQTRSDSKKSAATKKSAAKNAPPRLSATPSTRRQQQLQTEQRELQQRIARHRQQLARAEASHAEAADALAEVEAAISTTNRRLRQLVKDRQTVERQVATLQERSRNTGARQTEQERQLALVLRTQYARSREEPWQSLIDGADPSALAREQRYLAYVARAKAEAIDALRDRREELAELETELRERQTELADIARDEEVQRKQLLRETATHKRTRDQLARQIAAQRQSIAAMERDDQRLASLIDEIAKVLAVQARRRQQELERRSAEAKTSAPEKSNDRLVGKADSKEDGKEDSGPPAVPDAALAKLRGHMLSPLQGEVMARFGSPRRTEGGVNAPTWKGVFIRAAQGAEVHAVADGRVVFADWLRGFGNLLIVDHGNQVLSVYGNNETLLQNVGEPVSAGEVIATVGNTGGNVDSGLYFELRVQGRAVDPMRWVASR